MKLPSLSRRASATGEVDYVVIGAGSAGCVLANRLTESGTAQVLVLEAGGEDRNLYIRVPAGAIKIPKKYNWTYTAEPDASRNDIIEHWAAGKVLGGSSSINVTGWIRGHRADFDAWAEGGAEGWDYENVLPYFRRTETFEGGPSRFRGADGPLHVSYPGVEHPITWAYMNAAEQCGHPYNPDLNGELQEGVGYFQVSQRRGFRSSAATAYLHPVLRRRNLELKTHALVTRILIEDGRAVGVEYRHGGATHQVRARREVLLSAGSLASPKILKLSGIGPADELASHGIDVMVDNPFVGRNLQEHPIGVLPFRVNVDTLAMDLTPIRAMRHGINFVLRGKGAISASAATAVVFAKLDASHASPDLEMLFMPMAITRGGSEDKKTGRDVGLVKEPIVLGSVWLCHPRSRGEIRLRSSNPEDPPVIDHQVIGHKDDIKGLIKGLRLLRKIFGAEPMQPYVEGEVAPGAGVDSDEALTAYLHASVHRGEHAIGTCKMGTDKESVVDPHLFVRGIEGLRVVDASVMPTLMAGHTNAATIMIAERASDLIRATR